MSLEIQNDIRKIERVMEILNHIANIEFQTETGKEFKNTIQASVQEVIRPFSVDKYKELKSQLK